MMRLRMAVLVAGVLLAGCTKRGARIAGAGFGIGALGTMTLVVVQLEGGAGPVHDAIGVTGLLTTLVGGAIMYWGMGVGIKGFFTTEERPGPVVTIDPIVVARDRARAQAWELTKEAAAAARTDDCARVKSIEPEVRVLDTDFYDVVFMRDVAIARCLAT